MDVNSDYFFHNLSLVRKNVPFMTLLQGFPAEVQVKVGYTIRIQRGGNGII